jgi:hypothetical protein
MWCNVVLVAVVLDAVVGLVTGVRTGSKVDTNMKHGMRIDCHMKERMSSNSPAVP